MQAANFHLLFRKGLLLVAEAFFESCLGRLSKLTVLQQSLHIDISDAFGPSIEGEQGGKQSGDENGRGGADHQLYSSGEKWPAQGGQGRHRGGILPVSGSWGQCLACEASGTVCALALPPMAVLRLQCDRDRFSSGPGGSKPLGIERGISIMASSLQEQLLKAGLVSDQQARQSKSSKRKQKRRGDDVDSQAQRRAAERAAAEKQARDRELNRQRDEEAKRKAQVVALWQMIRDNRVPRERGDIAYNFTDGSALKRLYVNAEQQQGIVGGRLAIVRQDAFYELVPAEVAQRVAAIDASLIMVLNTPGTEDASDDDYADYKVPDDLMW